MKRIGKHSMWIIVLALAGAVVFAGYARYKKMTVRRDLSEERKSVFRSSGPQLRTASATH